MPMRVVTNVSSVTMQMRVVFVTSAKGMSKTSLNNHLLGGADCELIPSRCIATVLVSPDSTNNRHEPHVLYSASPGGTMRFTLIHMEKEVNPWWTTE